MFLAAKLMLVVSILHPERGHQNGVLSERKLHCNVLLSRRLHYAADSVGLFHSNLRGYWWVPKTVIM